MERDIDFFLNEAFKEAIKAYNKNEIPVGVVIVKDGKIISKGHNLRDTKKIVTKHAEIIAIEKANIKLNNWRLIDCDLYSTLEPCDMCKEIIKESKIRNIYFILENKKIKKNVTESNYIKVQNEELNIKCSDLIKNKFSELRKKSKTFSPK